MIELTLMTRRNCHLCEQMKRVVSMVAERRPVALTEIDVESDPGLEAQYGSDVPVLIREGQVLARSRVSVAQLTERLAATSR